MFYRNSDGMIGRDFVLEIHENFSVIIFVALIQKLIWGETVAWNPKVSFRHLCCFMEKVHYGSCTVWEVLSSVPLVLW